MLEVLQSPQQYRDARGKMRARGVSAVDSPLAAWLRRWNLTTGLPVGDELKSWDVSLTLDLIEERLPPEAPVLDLGAYCSEVPVALARMGYREVHGIDLNPDVRRMPMAGQVDYVVGDFMRTPFANASMAAVTAISVIEHGYQPDALCAEVGRLLRPGGLFIISFDYWPQKVDTGQTTFFGLSWLIFSLDDFQALTDKAARHGLRLLGDVHPEATERPIRAAGFDYTFAWAAFVKD